MPTHKPYNELELLAALTEGDEAAFAELFEHYKDRIYSIAFRLTHSTVLAEEIVQDIFLTIWLRRTQLKNIQSFKAYLFVITRNEACGALKRIARHSRIGSADTDLVAHNETDHSILAKEYQSLLQTAVDRLPKQQRQVYRLIKEEQLRREEVAHLLHIQPDTVKYHLAEAMKNIRAFFALYLGVFLAFVIGFSLLLLL
ncbi:MAG TPA: sigma-70 family RNA polymerase sigma factor [Puia sp.]|nr:sigma-70 family RNA polymerase sigma factor [Puia sp.]